MLINVNIITPQLASVWEWLSVFALIPYIHFLAREDFMLSCFLAFHQSARSFLLPNSDHVMFSREFFLFIDYAYICSWIHMYKNKHVFWNEKTKHTCKLKKVYCLIKVLMHITKCYRCSTLALITGGSWAKRGERCILHKAQNECEAGNEGRRKIKHRAPPLVSHFALVSRFPQNAAFGSLGS